MGNRHGFESRGRHFFYFSISAMLSMDIGLFLFLSVSLISCNTFTKAPLLSFFPLNFNSETKLTLVLGSTGVYANILRLASSHLWCALSVIKTVFDQLVQHQYKGLSLTTSCSNRNHSNFELQKQTFTKIEFVDGSP